jgi:hypothetical protein
MASVSRIRVMVSLLVNASPGLETANQPTVNASRGRGMQSPAIGRHDRLAMASGSRIRRMVSLLVNASRGLEMANQRTVNASPGLGMQSPATDPRDPHVMVSASRGPVTANPALTAVAVIGRAETLKRIR